MTQAIHLLREHLRQRRELGDVDLVLDGMNAAEMLELMRAAVARSVPPEGSGPAGGLRSRVEAVEEPALAPREGDARAPAVEAEEDPALTPRERVAGAPAPGPTLPAIVQLGGLAELRATALGCPRCRLAETRTQVVFGEGSETARLMVVGEAPGAEEDRAGRPFVGRAGRLLDRLLASVGFPRESVYICNVLKCRPPGNRDPQSDEIEACSPYLRRQVELVAPGAILTVGTFPSQTLLGSGEPIGRLRGRVHRYQGTPLVPTYHPAAVLRNPGWIRPVWEDLQRLRTLLDGEASRA
jgi:uracil-DNA glycosylase